MNLTTLITILLSILGTLGLAAGGGVFIKRSSFKPSFELLQKAVESYEQVHILEERKARLTEEQLELVTKERDIALQAQKDAIAAREAERARAAKLDRMIADNVLEREAWARERDAWARERSTWQAEKAALGQRISDLESQTKGLISNNP
ncbi:MAG: hypothetical protein JWO59_760 [Chloroflexi bacterium]|nr:hypothetical protein [Chloroflexota bacterium]